MSYEKQTWNKYDDLKTEEENIENGAVVTDNRMNHIEEGIYSHTIDISNPHKVTAAQVGLGNIQNFGLATEDEAKQAISNAKYMTPSLTQAVLSANINSIAYANSADGTDGFTTVYPNLNLLTNSRLQSGNITPFAPVNKAVLTINSNVKGLNVSCGSGAISYQQGVGQGVIPISAGNQYTISVKVINTGTVAIDNFQLQFGFYNSSETGITYPNKSFSIPADGKVYSLSFTYTAPANTTGMRYYCLDTATLANVAHTFTIYDMKAEQGSTATPYMPSASEVTTADWPKYVGFSNTVKTNKSASDYTWFPVKDSELTNKVESHVNNKSNPHAVTASQVGAYSKTEADVKFATGQSLIDLSTTVKGKADDSAVVHKTGDETIGGKKTFTEEIKQKNDVDWTYIPDSSNRAEYMRRGGTVTIRWDFTSTGNFDISLGSLPTDFAPRKRIFKSIPEASTTNSMHTLQINAFTGGSPGAITLFKATTGAVFSGQESFVIV